MSARSLLGSAGILPTPEFADTAAPSILATSLLNPNSTCSGTLTPPSWVTLFPTPAFRHVLHFPSLSTLSRTRNAVILRISGKGSGFSSGNWIDPFAVAYLVNSFANAFTADGVG
jgi:hypothetical protein